MYGSWTTTGSRPSPYAERGNGSGTPRPWSTGVRRPATRRRPVPSPRCHPRFVAAVPAVGTSGEPGPSAAQEPARPADGDLGADRRLFGGGDGLAGRADDDPRHSGGAGPGTCRRHGDPAGTERIRRHPRGLVGRGQHPPHAVGAHGAAHRLDDARTRTVRRLRVPPHPPAAPGLGRRGPLAHRHLLRARGTAQWDRPPGRRTLPAHVAGAGPGARARPGTAEVLPPRGVRDHGEDLAERPVRADG